MLGSKLSSICIRHIENEHNGYVVNIIHSGKSGTADLLACINGKFFAFEIKGSSDITCPLQDEKLCEVSRAGGYGGYVYSVRDLDDIVENLIQPNKKRSKKPLKL